MTKVISIEVPGNTRLKMQVLIEYPLLQTFLDDGWELMETLPIASNGKSYLQTFVLETETEALIKKESLKTRATLGGNAKSRTAINLLKRDVKNAAVIEESVQAVALG